MLVIRVSFIEEKSTRRVCTQGTDLDKGKRSKQASLRTLKFERWIGMNKKRKWHNSRYKTLELGGSHHTLRNCENQLLHLESEKEVEGCEKGLWRTEVKLRPEALIPGKGLCIIRQVKWKPCSTMFIEVSMRQGFYPANQQWANGQLLLAWQVPASYSL